MIRQIDSFKNLFKKHNIKITIPNFSQTLKKIEIKKYIKKHDGWIIGDEIVDEELIRFGISGKLKAAVKWGVGTDNLDKSAIKKLKFPIPNTPFMFGKEVADIAIGYLIGLARDTFFIDRNIRNGHWLKPTGISLENKVVALIGMGNIGRNIFKRLKVFDMQVNVYDPAIKKKYKNKNINVLQWPINLEKADFLIFCCSLNNENKYMLNKKIFKILKKNVRIINVSRGKLINEKDLIAAMKKNKIKSVALDVFEKEPISKNSYLVKSKLSILGSHNASNTVEAVKKTSEKAIYELFKLLNVK